ncbi:MAG: AAA family ATPase [Desulfobacteraceae bacterium]|nr:AAA family ATPase [Desulfobacteraceae bacterium]
MNRFFGRKNEHRKLAAVFDRVQKGGFEQVMVSGPAGVGKTTLVRQFTLVTEQKGGGFIFGKAAVRRAKTPLAPVRIALDMLVKKVIANDPENLARTGKIISDKLGPELDQAVALVPALRFLFKDPLPAYHQKTPQNDFTGLNNLICSLFEGFAPCFKGLVIFFDDLQWLDAASHKFLRHLAVAPELKGVMLVLGFRNPEANPLPGLSKTRKIFRGIDSCLPIILKGLPRRDISAYLKDRLQADQDIKPLSDLCYEKTHGNPFYLIQLVDDLLAQEAIRPEASGWIYDVDRIGSLTFSENVADLIISRLRRLSQDVLMLLQIGACIQKGIPVSILSSVTELPLGEIDALLWKPLKIQFLVKKEQEYHFSHDKILEAVDGLIDDEQRTDIHKRLAAYYLETITTAEPGPLVFILLHHYGFYRHEITDPKIKKQMVRHFFHAGQQARDQTAFDEALNWFNQGKAHFPGNIWHSDYDLALSFCSHGAECAYLAGNYQAAVALFNEVDENARSFADRLRVEMVKIPCYQAMDQLQEALATGISVLDHLGVRMPENPSWARVGYAVLKTWALLVMTRPSVLKYKEMPQQGNNRTIVKVLTALGGIAFYLNPIKLIPMFTSLGLAHIIKHGNTSESAIAHINFGMLLIQVTGSAKWGRKLGAIARENSKRWGIEANRSKEMFLSSFFLDHWDHPLQKIIENCEKGKQICLRHEDHEYYSYYTDLILCYLLIKGHPIHQIRAKIVRETAVLERLNHRYGILMLAIHDRALGNLEQGLPKPWELGDDLIDPDRLTKQEGGVLTSLAVYRFYAAFFSGRYDAALAVKAKMEHLIDGEPGTLVYYYFHFLAALAELNEGKQRKPFKKHLKILKNCARNNPAFYQPRLTMIQAEDLRINGRLDKAKAQFEEVRKALEHEPDALYEKALILAKLGQIAQFQNDASKAKKYLDKAIARYRQWGLKWKEGLFSTDATRVSPTENSSGDTSIAVPSNRRQSDQKKADQDISHLLFEILNTSRAKTVHAIVHKASQWKSIVYVNKSRGVNHPAIFIDLPQKMLNFAAAADRVLKLTARDSEESFFDTAYFFKQKPESLVVIPKGPAMAVCIENPVKDADMDTLAPLAEKVFKLMEQEVELDQTFTTEETEEILRFKTCCQKLQDHMAQKKEYKNPELGLSSLASDLDISPRLITDAIKNCLGQNFNTFVKSYRIEAVKQEIKTLGPSEKTILEIAFEQGFSTKSNFNRIFREFTGMTPSEYREQSQAEVREKSSGSSGDTLLNS